MKHNLLITICSLLIVLFMYTGASKYTDLKSFASDINNQPFPNFLTPYLVVIIPGVELVTAVCLLYPATRRTGLYASVVLMSAFTIYTVLVLLHVFAYVPCSCGGVIKKLTWPQHLVFNLFFLSLAITALKLQRTTLDIEHRT